MAIKNKDDFYKALTKIKPEDKEDLKFVRDNIQKIIDSSSVSEESTKELYNCVALLLSTYNKFIGYNFIWLKQGYMED